MSNQSIKKLYWQKLIFTALLLIQSTACKATVSVVCSPFEGKFLEELFGELLSFDILDFFEKKFFFSELRVSRKWFQLSRSLMWHSTSSWHCHEPTQTPPPSLSLSFTLPPMSSSHTHAPTHAHTHALFPSCQGKKIRKVSTFKWQRQQSLIKVMIVPFINFRQDSEIQSLKGEENKTIAAETRWMNLTLAERDGWRV